MPAPVRNWAADLGRLVYSAGKATFPVLYTGCPLQCFGLMGVSANQGSQGYQSSMFNWWLGVFGCTMIGQL